MELSVIDESYEVIIGIHSIVHALKNPNRLYKSVFGTADSLKILKKRVELSDQTTLPQHDLQQFGKRIIEKLGFNYTRIPGNLFLISKKKEEFTHKEFYSSVEKSEKYKLLILDQVSDVHNAAAIMRSCAFFGVNTLIVSAKNSFGISPGFTRIASGAYEHVNLLQVGSIAKFLPKLKTYDFEVVGLSEHAEESIVKVESDKTCLVMGNEEKGISNAVSRQLDKIYKLSSSGPIDSLNVSTATALAMERCLKPY